MGLTVGKVKMLGWAYVGKVKMLGWALRLVRWGCWGGPYGW